MARISRRPPLPSVSARCSPTLRSRSGSTRCAASRDIATARSPAPWRRSLATPTWAWRCRRSPRPARWAVVGRAPPFAPDPPRRAYRGAAGDQFDAARLSAVAALAAIAQASGAGRIRVANRFVAVTPRAEDYLVRRLAAAKLPDAAAVWGPVAPIATGRTDADYRDAARRYLVPALQGAPLPTITIETDRGTLVVQLLAGDAPLTVAAFLGLVDRRFFHGNRWHRVVPNFVVQDGDPRGDGWGWPPS